MKRTLLLLLVLFAACKGESPTDPTERGPRGRLSGVVTIGPNCPGPVNCPTTPAQYAQRKVVVYDENRSQLLFTIDIDSTGFYFIDLRPAIYTIDLQGLAADRTADVPRKVEIFPNVVTPVDIRVDTGLR
ncbi:MAG TPA: hypothetical protein VF698_21210 [Thermoanaerobaculia bacterium]